MKILISIWLLFNTGIIFSQAYAFTKLRDLELNGKVKQVESKYYTVKEQNRSGQNQSPVLKSYKNYTLFFGRSELLDSTYKYKYFDSLENELLINRVVYNYHDGKLVNRIQYDVQGIMHYPEMQPDIFEFIYENDTTFTIVHSQYQQIDDIKARSANERYTIGKTQHIIQYLIRDTILAKELVIEFDNFGRKISSISNRNGSDRSFSKFYYEKDESREPSFVETFNSSDQKVSSEHFKYNFFGELTHVIIVDEISFPKKSKTFSYQYRYDDHNNWFEKIKLDDSGKLIDLVWREFTYWE